MLVGATEGRVKTIALAVEGLALCEPVVAASPLTGRLAFAVTHAVLVRLAFISLTALSTSAIPGPHVVNALRMRPLALLAVGCKDNTSAVALIATDGHPKYRYENYPSGEAK